MYRRRAEHAQTLFQSFGGGLRRVAEWY